MDLGLVTLTQVSILERRREGDEEWRKKKSKVSLVSNIKCPSKQLKYQNRIQMVIKRKNNETKEEKNGKEVKGTRKVHLWTQSKLGNK